MKLSNYLSGEWIEGNGAGIELSDPVTGEALVIVSSDGADLASAMEFARDTGSSSLQAMSYQQRAEKLAEIADLLIRNKQNYYDISLKNSCSTLADCAFKAADYSLVYA